MCRDILYWPGMKSTVHNVCVLPVDSVHSMVLNTFQNWTVTAISTIFVLVSQDIFQWWSCVYLLTFYQYSDFFEVDILPGTLAATIVAKSCVQFSWHGILEVLLDNVFSSWEQNIPPSVHHMASINKLHHRTGHKETARQNQRWNLQVSVKEINRTYQHLFCPAGLS